MTEKDVNFYAKDMDFWKRYHHHRPAYPEKLFDILFDYHAQHSEAAWQLAIDYGSGPGTIIPNLLTRFHKVIGTDMNVEQIEGGRAFLQEVHGVDRVDMQVGAAGQCDWLQSQSADLVIAAEAVHWFDVEQWTAEAGRVLKPGGTLAFWFYPPQCVFTSTTDKAQDYLEQLFYEREKQREGRRKWGFYVISDNFHPSFSLSFFLFYSAQASHHQNGHSTKTRSPMSTFPT